MDVNRMLRAPTFNPDRNAQPSVQSGQNRSGANAPGTGSYPPSTVPIG